MAAGRSERFGGGTPKQFLNLGAEPVLSRAIRVLADRPQVSEVIVVLAPDAVTGPRGQEVAGWSGVRRVVAGGRTRAESVLRGLEAVGCSGPEFVLVHDAARPLTDPRAVERVIEATRVHGAAVPLLPVVDTVKRVDGAGQIRATLDRRELGLAQTPQGSRRDWLLEALRGIERDGSESPTDEAAALERSGHPVMGVTGDPGNTKITTPDDLERAERRLGADPGLRVGAGFDVHRRDPTRPLWLGGVRFEGEPGLVGHSDADVLLHAAMDAVLGAACLGDIGIHFPPDESRWKDARSSDLARRVATVVADAGYGLVNLDIMLLAESPRVGSRSAEMRESIAACLGTTPDRVGLKATTLERLGALGRGEGIACQAVALLQKLWR